jgi:hypothetical protein
MKKLQGKFIVHVAEMYGIHADWVKDFYLNVPDRKILPSSDEIPAKVRNEPFFFDDFYDDFKQLVKSSKVVTGLSFDRSSKGE